MPGQRIGGGQKPRLVFSACQHDSDAAIVSSGRGTPENLRCLVARKVVVGVEHYQYVEQATIELLIEYVRIRSDPRIQSYVECRVRRLSNLNTPKLINVLCSFDQEWRSKLEMFIVNEYKDALDGLVDLRNTVAHGGYAGGVTLSRIDGYYVRIKKIIKRIADLLVPV